jgi:hypothetical protein
MLKLISPTARSDLGPVTATIASERGTCDPAPHPFAAHRHPRSLVMKSALTALAVALSLVATPVASAGHHTPHPHAAGKHHPVKAHAAAMACRTRAC